MLPATCLTPLAYLGCSSCWMARKLGFKSLYRLALLSLSRTNDILDGWYPSTLRNPVGRSDKGSHVFPLSIKINLLPILELRLLFFELRFTRITNVNKHSTLFNEDDFQSSRPSFGRFGDLGSRKRHRQPRLSTSTVCCSSPLFLLSVG